MPVLQTERVSKRFGNVTALEDVDFEVYPNEIACIVGDNGAGKSTLIKIVSGALQPDSGRILIGGHEVHLRGPADARQQGIETVYQDLAVAPGLDIASNLFLGREERRHDLVGDVDCRRAAAGSGVARPRCRQFRADCRRIRGGLGL